MKIERFKPLNGCGLAPVDLHTCLLLPVFHQDVDHPDYPQEGTVYQTIYRTPDNKHWIEHVESFEPWDAIRQQRTYEEVTPWYAAQELGEAGREMPRDLKPYWQAIQEYKKTAPWTAGKLLGQRDTLDDLLPKTTIISDGYEEDAERKRDATDAPEPSKQRDLSAPSKPPGEGPSPFIFYRPWKEAGEVALNLRTCPRRFPLTKEEFFDVVSTVYLTAEGQWIFHDVYEDPEVGRIESYQEIPPSFAAIVIGNAGVKLPVELVPYWKAYVAKCKEDEPGPPIDISKINPELHAALQEAKRGITVHRPIGLTPTQRRRIAIEEERRGGAARQKVSLPLSGKDDLASVPEEAGELLSMIEQHFAARVGHTRESMAKRISQTPTINSASSDEGRRPPKQRLKAVLDANPPYLLLDGKTIPCRKEAAVHYVARLIEADGERVAFSEWVAGHPEFEGERSNRVLKALPEEVRSLIDNGQGKEPRLRIEVLH